MDLTLPLQHPPGGWVYSGKNRPALLFAGYVRVCVCIYLRGYFKPHHVIITITMR
jgi:hypothetical protein